MARLSLFGATVAVPRQWPGATMVVAASGPSLTRADLDAVQAAGLPMVAVNDAVRLAPWADVLYACDAKWYVWHAGTVAAFPGPKYSLERAARAFGANILRQTGVTGLELDPRGLRTGSNSGYQAINLAVHLGARRIILLGFDMRAHADGRDHYFGAHPDHTTPPYARCLPLFTTLVAPLAEIAVEVLNATPGSAIDVFPRVTLAEVLADRPAALEAAHG